MEESLEQRKFRWKLLKEVRVDDRVVVRGPNGDWVKGTVMVLSSPAFRSGRQSIQVYVQYPREIVFDCPVGCIMDMW